MTTVEEMKASLDTTNANLDAANLKLDEIRAYIATLVAGAVTQEQLDELAALAASSASKSAEVLAEADALDASGSAPE